MHTLHSAHSTIILSDNSISSIVVLNKGINVWWFYRDEVEVYYQEPGLGGFKPLVENRFNTLWFPFINTFSIKNINTCWSKSKINAKIIIVQLFLSIKHPSSYEMVRPSGKQLLIRRCCARGAYCVMWRNCSSRCSRPIGMKKLSYKHRCKLACHAHVSTLFTGVIYHQSEWINCLRYLWIVSINCGVS